jgi:cephalosporin hydroxylase
MPTTAGTKDPTPKGRIVTELFIDHPLSPVDAYQNVGELAALWELVAQKPHARVLEIGSLFGGTLWHWIHLPHSYVVVSVDLVSKWHREAVLEAREQWPGWADDAGVELHVLEADSTDPKTLAAVQAASSYFDFAFIDGDHSYDGVRTDWLNYSPLVRSGGLVAFHDTWPNYDRHEPGVVQWVDELRHHLPSIEFTDPDGVGITAFRIP